MGPEEIALGIKGDIQRLARSIREIVTPNRVFGVPEQIIAAAFVTKLVLKAPSPSSVLEKASDLGVGNAFCAVLAIILGLVSGLLSPQQWQSLARGTVNGVELLAGFVRRTEGTRSSCCESCHTVQEPKKQGSHEPSQASETTPVRSATDNAAAEPTLDKGKGRADPEASTIQEVKPRRPLTDEEKAAIMQRRLAEKREMALRAKAEATGVGPSFTRPADERVKEVGDPQSTEASSRDVGPNHSPGSSASVAEKDLEAKKTRQKVALKQAMLAEAVSEGQSAVTKEIPASDYSSPSETAESPEDRARRKKEELKRETKSASDGPEDAEARKKRKEEALRLLILAKAREVEKGTDKTDGTSRNEDAEARRRRKEAQLAAYTSAQAGKKDFNASSTSSGDPSTKPAESLSPSQAVANSGKPRHGDIPESKPAETSVEGEGENQDERRKRKEEAYRQYKLAEAAEEARRAGAKDDDLTERQDDTAKAEDPEARAKRKAEELRRYLAEKTRRQQATELVSSASSKVVTPKGVLKEQVLSSARHNGAAKGGTIRPNITDTSHAKPETDSRELPQADPKNEADSEATSTARARREDERQPIAESDREASRIKLKLDAKEKALREHMLQREVRRSAPADSSTRPPERSELPYEQEESSREPPSPVQPVAEDLKARQRIKELAMRQHLAERAKLQKAAADSPDEASANKSFVDPTEPSGQKPLKSALKKPSVTFAGLPDIPTNQAPNYFLTKCGPARPALVPFPHGLHPKPGKPPGTLWFKNIPDDASQLMAPRIRSRKKSAA